MKSKLYILSNSLLFMGAALYFGTGWSTAIFQYPVMASLTPQNYSLHFIPQIDAATNFFTFLVTMMLITGVVMIIGEWKTRFRWVPIMVVLAVVGATCLTLFIVFPVNDILRQGITDQAQLMDVIDRWKTLTNIRVGIWTLEWVLMMYYFASSLLARPVAR